MTYLQFHLLFLFPPLALLVARRARRGWARLPPRAPLFLVLLPLIALAYTTPWDNYLVWRGVWDYGADRVLGTIGYVPVEEYLFFLLQPLLVGLWLYEALERGPAAADGEREAGSRPSARAPGAALYLALALAGVWLLRLERGTYLGLILIWAAPVLAAQWAFAAGAIRARLPAAAMGLALPTLYLWIADAIAIRLGIWGISPDLSSGILLLGLPLEEAVFFLATDLLVVQGLMLFLFPPARLSAIGYQRSVDSRRLIADD